MMSRKAYEEAKRWAWDFVRRAGIPLREEEREGLEVVELGLEELETTGLQILSLAATEWLGAKLLILRPRQFFPQHRHPPSFVDGYPGKTELLRGHYGEAWLYVPGEPTAHPCVSPPVHRRPHCTVWHEIPLLPGDQCILLPNTWHWFQAGVSGAVLWSISSRVTDAADQFSDPQVVRWTNIVED
jgi:D-lyxose ketol-isomerase